MVNVKSVSSLLKRSYGISRLFKTWTNESLVSVWPSHSSLQSWEFESLRTECSGWRVLAIMMIKYAILVQLHKEEIFGLDHQKERESATLGSTDKHRRTFVSCSHIGGHSAPSTNPLLSLSKYLKCALQPRNQSVCVCVCVCVCVIL